MAKPIKMFLSYSRGDEEFARKLAADLKAEGFEPWLDVSQLKPGETWEAEIKEAIGGAELLLVLLSSASVKSPWVIREAQLASSKGKGRVIPVIIDARAKSDVPDSLKDIQWLDLSTPERYTSGLSQLSKLIVPEGSERGKLEPVRGIALSTITTESVTVRMPRGHQIGDIIDVDDFVAKVVDKLRLQIPLKNEDKWHSPGKPTREPPSNLVFVIMSFEEDMDPIFEGIKDAAAAAGLEAKRVKDVIGDYKIDSKLIDMIHQACMVVVDLTHERPNVYFELGYARGIAKPVITTARKGTPIHFDVQSWTCDFYSDSRVLEKRLKERFKIERDRLTAGSAAETPPR